MKPEEFKPGDLDRLIVHDAQTGEYLLHRDVFRDPALFELEMKYIFERNWVFVGLESMAPQPNDYYTGWIGRQPIVVMRDAEGNLGAYVNSCSHKGARIAHHRSGNAKQFVCSYHGWAYNTAGECIYIKDEESGCYAEPFNKLDHNLRKLKFGEYRGFLFASLSDEVPSLEEHLGETRKLLDLVWDQGPEGVEALPGVSTYTFDANWKMQIENCLDLYHLTSCHPSFMNIVNRRKAGESGNRAVDSADISSIAKVKGGSFMFPRGHAMAWTENPNERSRPLYRVKDDLVECVGQTAADWMMYTRNLTIYPNVQFADNAALQLRVIRPLAVDKTEMTIYCLAPKGESDAAREARIRQYEDFYNTTGLATPDDTIAYEDCQAGYAARVVEWQQGYCRGVGAVQEGADKYAAALGVSPQYTTSGDFALQDETIFHNGYRAWQQFLREGLAADFGG